MTLGSALTSPRLASEVLLLPSGPGAWAPAHGGHPGSDGQVTLPRFPMPEMAAIMSLFVLHIISGSGEMDRILQCVVMLDI